MSIPAAIGRLVRAVAASEELDARIVAKAIASPVTLVPHLRRATERGTHVRAIAAAMADLPAAKLPASLTVVEQGEAWLAYHQSASAARAGASRSAAKAEAARTNGAKGGRPENAE